MTPTPKSEAQSEARIKEWAKKLHGHDSSFGDKSDEDECVENATQSILQLIKEARIEAFEEAHKCVDKTEMILTNDLPSLLGQDDVARTRKQHKKEIHANIDKAIKSSTTGKEQK